MGGKVLVARGGVDGHPPPLLPSVSPSGWGTRVFSLSILRSWMRPQAEAWPLRATLLGGHPCGPVWLPRLAGGHGGVSRPWVPISSPSPRTLSQPGDICVV